MTRSNDQPERAGDRHRQRPAAGASTARLRQQRVGLQSSRASGNSTSVATIGADRDEGAVAEIEHVHQAEHQRQAGRHDEDHHAHGEARDRQRHPGRACRADQRQHASARITGSSTGRIVAASAWATRLKRQGRSLMRLQAEARASAAAAPRRRPAPPSSPRWTILPLSITSDAVAELAARRGSSARPAGWWRRGA